MRGAVAAGWIEVFRDRGVESGGGGRGMNGELRCRWTRLSAQRQVGRRLWWSRSQHKLSREGEGIASATVCESSHPEALEQLCQRGENNVECMALRLLYTFVYGRQPKKKGGGVLDVSTIPVEDFFVVTVNSCHTPRHHHHNHNNHDPGHHLTDWAMAALKGDVDSSN